MRAPWDEPSHRHLHGVYLVHRATGCHLHVRGGPPGTLPELEAMLSSQQWAGPPKERVVRRIGATVIVAGTYPCAGGGTVREWFLSDGKRGANAALVATAELAYLVAAACEELLDTVTWEEGSPA